MVRIKKGKLSRLFAVLILSIAVFAAIAAMPAKTSARASGEESSYSDADYQANFGVYQGAKNWYYLYGDFAANDLYYMAYNYEGEYWLGGGDWARIQSHLDMGPDNGDVIRAWRSPFNGSVNIAGEILNKCNAGSDGVNVSIVHRPASAVKTDAGDVNILTPELIEVGDPDITLTGAAYEDIQVDVGDILFFVLNQNSGSGFDGARFNVIIEVNSFTEAADTIGDTLHAKAHKMNFGIDTSQNNSDSTKMWASGIIMGLQKPSNSGTMLTLGYVSASVFTPFTVANIGNGEYSGGAPGGGTGIWWGNEYGSRPDEHTGHRYTVPRDGKVNIAGVIKMPAAGQDAYIDVVKNNNVIHTVTSSIPSEVINLSTVTEFQGITVSEDDEIYLLVHNDGYYNNTYVNVHINYYATAGDMSLYSGPTTDTEDPYNPSPSDTPAYTDIGTTQGTNNFYLLYGKAGVDYYKMQYDASGWKGKSQYNSILNKTDFSPDGGDDAILMWRAPKAGTVTFEGAITKDDMTGSDGVVISIHKRASYTAASSQIFSKTYTLSFTKIIDLSYTVAAGEMYFFSVGQSGNSAYDSVKVLITAALTGEAGPEYTGTDIGAVPDLRHITAEQYRQAIGTTQGGNNWYKLYGDPMSDYFKMTLVEQGGSLNGNTWQGASTYNNIWWMEDFGPDGGDDAIIMWRAPANGTVSFAGKAVKAAIGGSDGVTIAVVKKQSAQATATEIEKTLYTTAFTKYFAPENYTYTVAAGEMYFFAVGQNSNSADDSTKLYIYADFTENSGDPGTLPGGGIGDMLSATPEQYTSYFGDEQGHNNWYYLYGGMDRNRYYYMTYDSQNTKWNGSEQYCGMSVNDQHPGNGEDAIKMWYAPADGTADIIGRVSGSYTSSDGVIVTIWKKLWNSTSYGEPVKIWERTLTSASNSASFTFQDINVTRGDMYFFSVNCNETNAGDSTDFKAYIDFTQTGAGTATGQGIGIVENLYTFGTTQGYGNWYYAYGTAKKYALMTYGLGSDANEKWISNEPWAGIDSGNHHPGQIFGAVKIFIAPTSGTLCLEGFAHKLQTGGEGAYAAIYLNGTKLWDKTFSPAEDKFVLPASLKSISVQKGDRLIFEVSALNKNNSYCGFNYEIELFWINNIAYTPGENLDLYVLNVSHLELLGVNIVNPDDYFDNDAGVVTDLYTPPEETGNNENEEEGNGGDGNGDDKGNKKCGTIGFDGTGGFSGTALIGILSIFALVLIIKGTIERRKERSVK